MILLAKNSHGNYNSTLSHEAYNSYKAMWSRCYRAKDIEYKRYGGRGIKVWEGFKDFKSFVEELGPKPTPAHTLDRINNNGNYVPGNIRWASKSVQSVNQRLNSLNTSGYRGVRYHKVSRKWNPRITDNRREEHLGLYDSPFMAALAYDNRARELGRSDSVLNFPELQIFNPLGSYDGRKSKRDKLIKTSDGIHKKQK